MKIAPKKKKLILKSKNWNIDQKYVVSKPHFDYLWNNVIKASRVQQQPRFIPLNGVGYMHQMSP